MQRRTETITRWTHGGLQSRLEAAKLQLREEEEWQELISTLPGEKRWKLYQYQGFWQPHIFIKGVMSCQKHFQVQDSDVFLITTPKSGTTWLKAILFTLLNRKQYPVVQNHDHPLLMTSPHDLVSYMEGELYGGDHVPDIASFPSPRLFSTHMPYVCLPECVKNSSACKLVYLCRNPKDTFVSLWHFMNKLKENEAISIGEAFEMFCKGVSPFGPLWDHVLEYWKESKENPDRVLFVKYEDMKEQPGLQLRRLAEFLDCRFTADEEESGVVDEIVKLCSFDFMRSLEVNRTGRQSHTGTESKLFFRRGEMGDWKNHLDSEMVQKIDQITEEKFRGSGLVL